MKLYKQNESVVYFGQVENAFDQFLSNDLVLPFFQGKSGSVLDLGCGGGRNLVALAKMGYTVTAVDYHDVPLKVARRYARQNNVLTKVKILKHDITKLKTGALGKFDYCLMQEVIEHIPDYQKAVNFSYSSLRKNGTLILTTQVKPELWTKLDDYAQHVRRFREDEVLLAVKKFSRVDHLVTGFPFHRLSHFLYEKWLRAANKNHDTAEFAKSPLRVILYSRVYPFFMRLDRFFDFTKLGKNMVLFCTK
jgi:SAM-dependent methyltransferase